MQVTRRQFFKVCGAGVSGSTITAMGFSTDEVLAQVREFKLARTTETRNTCPYCSVSCGLLMYSVGDKAKNARARIFHIEGDPDHPVNRGTLCPKGAALLDFSPRFTTTTSKPTPMSPSSWAYRHRRVWHRQIVRR